MMRKLFYISISVFFIILSPSLNAQDYQAVNSGRIAFFYNQNGEFKCIHIDSARFQTDSLLYPAKNIQKTGYECYTPYGASLSGSKIILQANGINLFFNRNADTIKLKTKAFLQDSWVAYEIPDSVKIIASVITTDTTMTLGLLDSVKTISFMVYDKNMNPVNHALNQMTIAISKTFGFTRTLDFNSFPSDDPDDIYEDKTEEYYLAGLSEPRVGITNLTWTDAYDIRINDEIHILQESRTYGVFCNNNDENYKSIHRYIDRKDYPDSIIFTIDRIEEKQKTWFDGFSHTFSHDTITTKIIPLPHFDNLPGEPLIIGASAYLNTMNIGELVSKTIDDKVFYFSENNCWGTPIEDGCLSKETYIQGIGGPYYYCSGGIDCYSEFNRQPVYYKKGNSRWGTPLVINAIKQTRIEKKFVIFPNPSKDEISINTSHSSLPFTIEIIDLKGHTLIKRLVSNSMNSIRLEGISSGIYLYRIILKQEIETGKLIIE